MIVIYKSVRFMIKAQEALVVLLTLVGTLRFFKVIRKHDKLKLLLPNLTYSNLLVRVLEGLFYHHHSIVASRNKSKQPLLNKRIFPPTPKSTKTLPEYSIAIHLMRLTSVRKPDYRSNKRLSLEFRPKLNERGYFVCSLVPLNLC